MSQNLPVPESEKSQRKPRPSRSRKLLPVLDIDWSKSPAEQILPCREQTQARHLEWHVEDVRSVNRNLGLYNSLPMLCQADKCHRAQTCPTAEHDFPFKGLRCPLEIIEAYRQLVQYIWELKVDPVNHTDLTQVGDLVRLDIQIKRIDEQVQRDGMMTDQIAGIAQKDGKAVYGKGAHQLLVLQRGLRKDRNDLYRELLASRDAREDAARKAGIKEETMTSVIRRLQEQFGFGAQPAARVIDPQVKIEELPHPALSEGDADDPDLDFGDD